MEYISFAGLRVDGRRPLEVRRLRCELGVLADCDGSCNLEQGNTKIAVAVFGPREVAVRSRALHDRAILTCSVLSAPFSTSERRKRRVGDRKSTAMAREIEKVFEAVVQTHLFKRSQIDIVVTILQTDGSVLSTAINAVNLALIDAGVPMNDFVIGCTVGYLENTTLLDINYQEEAATVAPTLTVAITPQNSKVLSIEMVSKVSVTILEEMLERAIVGCQQLFTLLDAAVRERTENLLESRGALSH